MQLKCDGLLAEIQEVYGQIKLAEKEIDNAQAKARELDRTVYLAEAEVDKLKGSFDKRRELEQKILKQRKRENIFKEDLEGKTQDLQFYEYCEESFSRKGLP